MFKLVVMFGLLAVVLAKPSENNPRRLTRKVRAATIIAEKTIESHGHSIIHHTAPSSSVSIVAQVAPILPAVPLAITEVKQLSEKSEKVETSSKKLELSKEKVNVASQQLLENKDVKVLSKQAEAQIDIPQKPELSVDAKKLSKEENKELEKGRQLLEKNESYEKPFVHSAEPATLSYLATASLIPALTPTASPVVPKTANDFDKFEFRPTKQDKPEGHITIPFWNAQLRTSVHTEPLIYVAAVPGPFYYLHTTI